ncbi:MAG: hypothetical protein FWG24_04740 [Eggerthellaceae bacterium]|jgi:hypothetical protein|nr:hypothetical protein [Eggerthellaceae bacterium]
MTKKKKYIVLLSALLTVVLAAGLTFAYLFTKTDELTNMFTFGDNIKAELTEPNWDEDEAKDLVPGKVVPKDPQITNTSENEISEWVAIHLTFTDGASDALSDADMARLLDLITIDWNMDDWTLADSAMQDAVVQVWAYNYEVAPGETTTPLFNTVTINETVSPDDLEWLRETLVGFNIVLVGGAVQYDAFDTLDAAIVALLELLV